MVTAREGRRGDFRTEARALARQVREGYGDPAGEIAAAMVRAYRRGLDEAANGVTATAAPETRWQDLSLRSLHLLSSLAGWRDGDRGSPLAEVAGGYASVFVHQGHYKWLGKDGEHRCSARGPDYLLRLGLAEWKDAPPPFGRVIVPSQRGRDIVQRWRSDLDAKEAMDRAGIRRGAPKAALQVDAERLRRAFRDMANKVIQEDRGRRKAGHSTDFLGRIAAAMEHAYACGTGEREALPKQAALPEGWEDYDPEVVSGLPKAMRDVFLDLCKEALLDPASRFEPGGYVRVAIGEPVAVLVRPLGAANYLPRPWQALVLRRTGPTTVIRRELGERTVTCLVSRGLLALSEMPDRTIAGMTLDGIRAYMAREGRKAMEAGADFEVDWGRFADDAVEEAAPPEASGPPRN